MLRFLTALLDDLFLSLVRHVVMKDRAVLDGLRVILHGYNEFDIGRNAGGQPKLVLDWVSLQIHAVVNSFQNDDNFGDFVFLVAQVLLLQELRSDFQPVFEIPP